MRNKLIKLACNIIPNKGLRCLVREYYLNKDKNYKNDIRAHWDRLLCSKENEYFADDKYINIKNIKFYKNKVNGGIDEIFGRYDYQFGGLKNVIFLDVGANIGDSALFAAINPNIEKIYSYEPFKKTYEMACSNIMLNPHLSSKIQIENFGWYNLNESKNVNVFHENGSAINSIENFFVDNFKGLLVSHTDIIVRKSSDILSEIIKNHKNNNIVLKMDIEGSEYECIKDLDNANLLKYLNVIFMEWHLKGYDEIINILEKNNFVWFNEKFEPEIGFIRAVNINKKYSKSKIT